MEWTLVRNDPEEARLHFEKKMRFSLGPVEVKHYMDEKAPLTVIDVRAPEAFAEGHVPGAISLPEEKWETLQGLQKGQPNIVYCYSVVCHLAAKACAYFASQGFSVIEMDGGMEYWEKMGLTVESGRENSAAA